MVEVWVWDAEQQKHVLSRTISRWRYALFTPDDGGPVKRCVWDEAGNLVTFEDYLVAKRYA